MENLGILVKQKRNDLDMTQGELAENLGISVGTLINVEKNKRFPRPSNRKKIKQWLYGSNHGDQAA